MKRLFKNRVLSLFLALTMFLIALPFNTVGANASENGVIDSNYGSVIGNTAQFNIEDSINFLIHNDPENFDYDTESGDWANDEYWIWYYSEENRFDFSEDLELVVTNYYWDSETTALWYKVEAAPGQTLPEKLEQYPWVYQNYTEYYEDPELLEYYPDLLTISNSGKNYVFDEDGNQISSLTFADFKSQKIYAESTLQGAVEYQWQVFSDGIWIDINDADEVAFTVSFGMIVNILDSNLNAKMRVVSTAGSKTVEGSTITVNFDPSYLNGEVAPVSYSLRSTTADYGVMTAAEDDTNVTESIDITIRFVNGQTNETVANDKTYNIQVGATLSETFELPVVEGYSAYLEDDTTKIYTSYTFNNVFNENTTITFKYWPAKVNYTVIYYWQNAEDDGYTEHDRYTATGFTGSDATVENLEYEGFYRLLYETVPIASDGSTVIEVYYDRLYYKMTFDLDGGYGVQPIYARYGTSIAVSNPTKAGYAFVGWDDVTSGTGDGIADTLPTSIPAHHSAYKAIWEANDSAKVTIVYWGENADDEAYSYIKSQEVYVKPGTELTFGTDQLVCTLAEHTHGDGNCTLNCTKAVHTHTLEAECYDLICTENSHSHSESGCTLSCTHTHTLDCYKAGSTGYIYSLITTSKPTASNLKNTGNGIYTYTTTGTYPWGAPYTQTHYYLNIGDQWYCAGRSNGTMDTIEISLNCSHTHTDTCYTCGKTEGTHVHSIVGGCYALICASEEHTHIAGCYSCIEHKHTDDCYLKMSNMDSDLWTYVSSDTVTVAADGSTVMNVYYDRTTFTITFHYNRSRGSYQSTSTITDKWGADIATRFLDVNTTAKGNLWSESTSGDSPWTSYLQIMPQRNVDYYCKHTSTDAQSAEYYIQELDGTYSLEYTVNAYYSEGSLTISEEDFYEMVGFTYSHGTDGDGDNMPSPGSYGDFDGAKFYYGRDSYILDFNNGEGVVKTESVLYEKSLSGYDFTPEVPSFYEPGSVTFAGWYLNPECTGEQYVLSEHTMPASNLILYAKWVSLNHTVRFFLDETLEFTDDNVYEATVDGTSITYKYNVPHGSSVQNPYTPPNDPTKGQYNFVGWFYIDANGNEQMWDFENTTVTRNTDIYAKWSSNILVPYTIKFVYKDADGKEIEIADPITGSALGGNSKTFEAKGNEQLYKDYQEGYFPTTQSHTIVMDLENEANNTFTFYYTKADAVPYTVYYVTDTQNDEETLTSIELNDKTYYIVADTKVVKDNKKAIVTETYVKVAGYLPDTYQQTLIIDPDEDAENIIIFEYDKDDVNGMYVVHYWTENLDGTYSEHSIFEGRGEKGSEVSATIKDIENFTYDDSIDGTVISGTISIEDVLELHVYYKRNKYPYKVQYLEQGTNNALAEEKVVPEALWEAIVTEKAIEITNYTLVSDDEVSIQIRKDTENPTVNIITFYYEPSNASLTIKKQFASDADIDSAQTFIFYIKGVEGTSTAGIDLTVTVHGAGGITITDLPVGQYIVTEDENWSWRYDVEGDSQMTVNLTSSGDTVTFINKKTVDKWLDDCDSAVNIFKKKKEEDSE